MRHRRGLALVPAETHPHAEVTSRVQGSPSFGELEEWYVLGGRCVKCQRRGWVNRWQLRWYYGNGKRIIELEPYLRCLRCGNKGDNRWIVGKLPR